MPTTHSLMKVISFFRNLCFYPSGIQNYLLSKVHFISFYLFPTFLFPTFVTALNTSLLFFPSDISVGFHGPSFIPPAKYDIIIHGREYLSFSLKYITLFCFFIILETCYIVRFVRRPNYRINCKIVLRQFYSKRWCLC